MTDRYYAVYLNKKAKAYAHARRFGYLYMSLFVMLLFFKNAEAASEWVYSALLLCSKKLIPSLFPFMVVSSLMVSSGLGSLVGKLLRLPFDKLFGMGADCACAVVLGWSCGFPVGARCASELYSSGKISASEYERILCVCSTPSPAFLIGAVGESMLGDARYGLALYAISILSALAVGIGLKLLKPLEKETRSPSRTAEQRRLPFSKALTGAVSDSATGMLCVCAFVVFFSAFLGTLEQTLSLFYLPDIAHSLLFCFFELTSGLDRICASHTPSSLVLPLCALAVGWSGLSVHFQTMAMCSQGGSAPSFKPYFLSHTVRAAICFALGTALALISF